MKILPLAVVILSGVKSFHDAEAAELTRLRARIEGERAALAQYLAARSEADAATVRYRFTPRARHDEEECRRIRFIGGLEEEARAFEDRLARFARVEGTSAHKA